MPAVFTPLLLLSELRSVVGLKFRTPRSAAVAPPFSEIDNAAPCVVLMKFKPVPAELICAVTPMPALFTSLSRSSTVAPARNGGELNLSVADLLPLVMVMPLDRSMPAPFFRSVSGVSSVIFGEMLVPVSATPAPPPVALRMPRSSAVVPPPTSLTVMLSEAEPLSTRLPSLPTVAVMPPTFAAFIFAITSEIVSAQLSSTTAEAVRLAI